MINFYQVCLQMFDAEGNIAICCKSGRSRSPMYLVIYLILFNDMTVSSAMNSVSRLLRRGRSECIDRYYTLFDFAVVIAAEVKK